jgi:hypothetical protein
VMPAAVLSPQPEYTFLLLSYCSGSEGVNDGASMSDHNITPSSLTRTGTLRTCEI